MALVDITNGWVNNAAVTETFTYQNGVPVNYTYSNTAGGGPYFPNAEVASFSEVNEGVVLEGIGNETAIVTFDAPVHGFAVHMTGYQGVEETEIYVDGQKIDLNTWLAEGKISFSGDSTVGDGSNLIGSDGHYEGHGDGIGGESPPIGNAAPNVSWAYFDDIMKFNVLITSIMLRALGPDGVDAATLHDFYIDDAADQPLAPCFTAGTLIDTAQGQAPVETLKAGDMIRTKDHGFQPVKWVGESLVYATGFDVPLRIRAGTFGNSRDLVVSPRHRMLIEGWELDLMFNHEEAFAMAKDLRNDDNITREPEGWVTYYHVLLPQHEVIYAEGAATESFYPDEGTLAGMAKGAKEELLKNVTPETYGPPARLTFDPMRAMWIGRNLDILNSDDMGQIAAYENAMKAAE